ncbi:uncharacterized protein TRAVEDRAFT_31818 [Trametes versicolor FP-101664 SS1]|uniref:uncharacterized protein n=1 Tax=Trametes versicolor (strain FP-101664) TaxID=717944 RepID=UPI00046237E5|nr:uncharacterized protein TRAVEDRAFT_31818 [Trametes versicolor FP-101664 SS1]EIW52682.1 hypothetical protein TRAVEDRAFT_31818 [Trametes versicolor FP-101664 SS1]
MADYNAVFQNCYYVGNNFNAILYGVELVLYFASVRLILSSKDKTNVDRRPFLYFSTALLVMITIYVAVQAVFGEEMWIVHADYAGGSAQYLADNAAVWYQTLGSASSIVLNLMSDGLLLYRCYVVWGDLRVIAFPFVLYLGTAALGILTCYVSGTPNADFFLGEAQQIALSYSSVVIGLNVTCSTLICVRILMLSRNMRGVLGADVMQTYTGAVALIVESALPYTLFGIAYVVSLGLQSPTSILFLSIYVMFTCISPQMIVLRVLMGRAWSRDAATRTRTSMHFNTPAGDSSMLTSGFTGTTAAEGPGGTAINLHALSHTSSSQRDLSVDKV